MIIFLSTVSYAFDFSLTIGYNVNTDNNVLFTFGLRY
nr:MAG TPA: hypothetical protein [Caudoviricetes sp.]